MSGYGAAGTAAEFDSGQSGPGQSSKQTSTAGSQISPQERAHIQGLIRTVSSNSSDFLHQNSRPLSRVSSASSLRSNSLGRRRRPGNHLEQPQYSLSGGSRSESNLIVPVASTTEPEEFSDTESLDGRRVRTKYASRPQGPRNNSWGGTLPMDGLLDDQGTEWRDNGARQRQPSTVNTSLNVDSLTRSTQLLRAHSSVESIRRRYIEAHDATIRNPIESSDQIVNAVGRLIEAHAAARRNSNGEGSSDPLRNASRPAPPRKNSDWEPAMARSRDNSIAASRNSAIPSPSVPQMSFEAFLRESNNQMNPPSGARHTAGLSPSPGRIRAQSNSSGIYGASSSSGTPSTTLPSRSTSSLTQTTTRRLHTDVVLPRWQPDAEVTFCPICRTQFSFFVRKHHCRKCGRVVCSSCSPHRITIPYQFIVQPPTETPSTSDRPTLDPSRAGSNFTSLGGGERVRLCNPCVPDPNVAPPQTPSFDGQRRPPQHSSHSRSSSLATPYYTQHQHPSGSQGSMGPTFSTTRRSRDPSTSGHGGGPTLQQQQSTSLGSDEYLSASGAAGARSRSSTSTGPYNGPQRYIRPGVPQLRSPYTHSMTSRDEAQQARERPLPHPPRLAEEDECPVCHRELPSSALPNSEALREAHISSCIENAFGGSGASPRPPPVPASRPPQSQASSSTAPPVPIANTPEARAAAREQAHAAVVLGHSASPGPVRRTRIFPYKATEKDCIDKAECTICLEEYEVNDEMGRLECLCRFHLKCINQWFERNHGQCPVHPSNGGY